MTVDGRVAGTVHELRATLVEVGDLLGGFQRVVDATRTVVGVDGAGLTLDPQRAYVQPAGLVGTGDRRPGALAAAEQALQAVQTGLVRRTATLDRAQDSADVPERVADERTRIADQRERAANARDRTTDDS
jgi:hypothetical protein